MQKESRRYYRLRVYSNLRQRKLSTVSHDSEKLGESQKVSIVFDKWEDTDDLN